MQTTTIKPLQTFSGHFMKKYEKYLRRNVQQHSITNSNTSYRKATNDIQMDKSHIDNNNNINNQHQKLLEKPSQTDTGIKYTESKHIYYEKLWPKTKNLRKKLPNSSEALETGLTALASFPVTKIFRKLIIYFA